jgi:hypothetical protein
MARSQGLLTGSSLSPAQSIALQMQDMDDAWKCGERDVQSLKIALVGNNPSLLKVLFPQVRDGSEADLETREEQDIPDEYEMAEMERMTQGHLQSISARELEDTSEEEWQ